MVQKEQNFLFDVIEGAYVIKRGEVREREGEREANLGLLDFEEEVFLHREGVLEDASDLENLASNFLGGGQKSAEKVVKEIIIGGDGWIGGEGDTIGG